MSELRNYFDVEDLRNYDCYEMIKELSEKTDNITIAGILENFGGGHFYIPNLESLHNVKVKYIKSNKNLPDRILAKKLNQSIQSIRNHKKH